MFVSWDSQRINKKNLCEIASIFGGVKLSKLMINYCIDYKYCKYWNHGMPDLILWDSAQGIVKFSEVKSENDRLSEVQRAWIAYMSQNGIDVDVCYVNRLPHNDDNETIIDPGIEVFTEELN
jgi:hypothetical protein